MQQDQDGGDGDDEAEQPLEPFRKDSHTISADGSRRSLTAFTEKEEVAETVVQVDDADKSNEDAKSN